MFVFSVKELGLSLSATQKHQSFTVQIKKKNEILEKPTADGAGLIALVWCFGRVHSRHHSTYLWECRPQHSVAADRPLSHPHTVWQQRTWSCSIFLCLVRRRKSVDILCFDVARRCLSERWADWMSLPQDYKALTYTSLAGFNKDVAHMVKLN